MADAKQIPIITEAFERLAGPEFSLAGLVGRKPGVKFGAQTFDVLVRKRHVKLNERLVKKRTSDPTPLVAEPRAATHQHSSDAREQSSTRQTKSNEPAQYALPCSDWDSCAFRRVECSSSALHLVLSSACAWMRLVSPTHDACWLS